MPRTAKREPLYATRLDRTTVAVPTRQIEQIEAYLSFDPSFLDEEEFIRHAIRAYLEQKVVGKADMTWLLLPKTEWAWDLQNKFAKYAPRTTTPTPAATTS